MPRFSVVLCTFVGFTIWTGCGGDITGSNPNGNNNNTSASTLSYYKDIAPLMSKYCSGCHVEGGIAPFALGSYQDVLSYAQAVKEETAKRTMPPFLADNSGACQSYRDARWMSDAEIKTIGDWVDAGKKEGSAADMPALQQPIVPTINPTQTLDMGASYSPNTSMNDDYRCFVINPGLATDKYIRAFQVKPGDPTIVHHMVLAAIDDAQGDADAAALDNNEEGLGYTCFGGFMVAGNLASRLVAVWAPGVTVTRYPENTGFLLKAGRKLILQVHYHLDHVPQGTTPSDRSKIDVELADSVTTSLNQLTVSTTNINLQAGKTGQTATATLTVPGNGSATYKIWGVFPHMHTLGVDLLAEETVGGQTTCLHHVPNWNFAWQESFFYSTPLDLKGGTQLKTTCTYDTTSRTGANITFGEGTNDEMCGTMFLVAAP